MRAMAVAIREPFAWRGASTESTAPQSTAPQSTAPRQFRPSLQAVFPHELVGVPVQLHFQPANLASLPHSDQSYCARACAQHAKQLSSLPQIHLPAFSSARARQLRPRTTPPAGALRGESCPTLLAAAIQHGRRRHVRQHLAGHKGRRGAWMTRGVTSWRPALTGRPAYGDHAP